MMEMVMMEMLPHLAGFVVWSLATRSDWLRYRSGRLGMGWLIFDVVMVLGCVALAWNRYARYQATLRERALAALAGPPPPPPPAQRPIVLKLGSRGPAVLLWKSRLCALGYMSTPVDDVFDAETAAATAAYQDSLGLVGDGVVGPRTRRRVRMPGWRGWLGLGGQRWPR